MLKYDFYRGWYLKSNGTIAIGVLSDLDLHFQDQTFSCYAFATKKNCACSGCPRQICLNSHGSAVVLLLLFKFCCFFNIEKPNYYVFTPARTWKVRQRGDPNEIIGSIYSVGTADADRCYLRLLLLHVCTVFRGCPHFSEHRLHNIKRSSSSQSHRRHFECHLWRCSRT